MRTKPLIIINTLIAGILTVAVTGLAVIWPHPSPSSPPSERSEAQSGGGLPYRVSPSETLLGLPVASTVPVFAVTVPDSALCPQYWAMMTETGWLPAQMATLDKIMWRESRCNPLVHNPGDPAGGSFGLLQVNGSWKKWLRDLGVITYLEDLYSPAVNLKASLEIWKYAHQKHDNGFGPWNGYNNE